MRMFFAGVRSRRWLNVGVFVLGGLALLVAVATPLYARSSAEHLLDQRIEQRPSYETGLNIETAAQVDPARSAFVSVASASGAEEGAEKPTPLSDGDREQMLASVTDLITSADADRFWKPPTTYLYSEGSYTSGPRSYQIKAYWRDGMCDLADVEGKCPSEPGEALIDPLMLTTIKGEVGDKIRVSYTRFDGEGNPVTQFPVDFTIVGTYTIDDPASPEWFNPARTFGDGTLRPPPMRSNVPLVAPSLLVDQSSVDYGVVAGADRPIDLAEVDIDRMDATASSLANWQTEMAQTGPPVIQPQDPATVENVFAAVDAEQTLLSRVTLAAVVPLVVLALLLLYVLIAAAAEVRRQEVALAKLRGFSARRVVAFAVTEPAVVLLLAVPTGIGLAVLLERTVARTWLGATPFVVTEQAIGSAVVVTAAALVAAFVAVLGVVREPLASSLSTVSRRRSGSRWGLLAQGALVMLSAAAVVQMITSDAQQSSSFVELLAPLFVALGASVLAMVLIGVVARGWLRRTATRGGLSPFLASRRLVRRQDLVQLVLPLLLATAMASFAASAWKVADDWRVSKAAATVGAPHVYFTETQASRLQWVTHQVDPEGRYLAAVVPPAPRTVDGGRVALVDASRFARIASWDDQWGTDGAEQVQGWLSGPAAPDPIVFSGTRLEVEVTDIRLEGELNFPLEVWVRYLTASSGEEHIVPLGKLAERGDVTLDGFVSECGEGCSLEQLYISGSSSSVTDAEGSLTIRSIAADGADPGDWRIDDPDAWRPARPYGDSGTSSVSVEAGADGLELELTGEPAVSRLTTTDVPAAPPLVATDTTLLDPDQGERDAVSGASVLGVRTPMTLAGTAKALPFVGSNGGLSDLTAALREHGDEASDVLTTELLVADGTPASMLEEVERLGVPLTDTRSESEELGLLRSDAFSLGWRVFLLVGVLTLVLAFLGVLALAIVQLRWRSYEVAALRVVGVRRRDLKRAIVTEYVALLGMAVAGGALAAIASLLLVLPSLDIGTIEPNDPAVDFSLRWLVVAGVLGVVLVVVLAIAFWISRRTVKQGTPSTLRQADAR